jgi:hypothetical protein
MLGMTREGLGMTHRLVLFLLAPFALRAQDVELRIRVDSAKHELLMELGPFSLPPHSGHDGHGSPPPRTALIPFDAWLHGYTIELVDDRDRPIPRSLMHHVNIIATERRDLFSNIMLRIGASGTETAPLRLPRFLGYRASAGDTVLVSSMLHNNTAVDYPRATLRIRVPYTTKSAWLDPFTIFPFYLDVMPPAGITHSYDLPPGRSEKFWEGKPAMSGRMLGVSGHLHKYGVELRLEDRTANKLIWSGKPTLDREGNVVAMPLKNFVLRRGKPGLPLDSTHMYRLTAIYDNPTGITIPDGGMGALGGVMVPNKARAWPLVKRDDPEYLIDLRATYRRDREPVPAANGSASQHKPQ